MESASPEPARPVPTPHEAIELTEHSDGASRAPDERAGEALTRQCCGLERAGQWRPVADFVVDQGSPHLVVLCWGEQ